MIRLLKEKSESNSSITKYVNLQQIVKLESELTALKSEKPEIDCMPLHDSPKNWKEDFSHENGNYMNRCMYCNEMFMGHKRRVVCRECAFKEETPEKELLRAMINVDLGRSEPRGETAEKPTDEEIEKWADNIEFPDDNPFSASDFTEGRRDGRVLGAKWMRNKLTGKE